MGSAWLSGLDEDRVSNNSGLALRAGLGSAPTEDAGERVRKRMRRSHLLTQDPCMSLSTILTADSHRQGVEVIRTCSNELTIKL